MKIDIQNFGSDKLHLGCGTKRLQGWINVDLNDTAAVDVNCDILSIEFEDGVLSEIYACHVFEHLEEDKLTCLLKSCFDWLKPNGTICIAVPDFDSIVEFYKLHGSLEQLRGLLLGGGKDEYDIHRNAFNFPILKSLLEQAGFNDICRYEWKEHFVGVNAIDDYSQAYLPHMNKDTGQLMSLNVSCKKY